MDCTKRECLIMVDLSFDQSVISNGRLNGSENKHVWVLHATIDTGKP